MMRASLSFPRNPWVIIVAIAIALLLVAGAAFAFLNLGSSNSQNGGLGGPSLASCTENRSPEADPVAFVNSGSDCFVAKRDEADGVWLSHALFAALTGENTKERSWQISQAKDGNAAVVEAGQSTDAAIPHIIAGDTDYVAVDLHPASLWLAENAPNALWVVNPAPNANWDAGRLDLIAAELVPNMGQWTGITNPDGSAIVTGYVDTVNFSSPWVKAVGAPITATFTRDTEGALSSIMIAGKSTMHIWKTLQFKKTLLPPLPTEGLVEANKIPKSEGAVIYDFLDLNAEIFIPGKGGIRPGPQDGDEDEPIQGPTADDQEDEQEEEEERTAQS